jgi:hypothetical protein
MEAAVNTFNFRRIRKQNLLVASIGNLRKVFEMSIVTMSLTARHPNDSAAF